MHYKPLSTVDRIEKASLLTNKIIVKALKSNRGDSIRAMNDVDLKMMLATVFYVVYNKLEAEAQRAYDYKFDKCVIEWVCGIIDESAEFKPRSDVEIEEEVTAYFEIDGKLQYREVELESFIALPGVDKSVYWLTQQMKMGELGKLYNPYSLADRLEKAGILTDAEIMTALLDERSDVIREMSHSDLKYLWKGVFSLSYQELYTEAADNFEQACEKYVPEWDGIANDPRKNFKPKTKFEIDQEIKAYFKEQGMLN